MTDDRPPSYVIGLFSAFLVRGGSADLKMENMLPVKEMEEQCLLKGKSGGSNRERLETALIQSGSSSE